MQARRLVLAPTVALVAALFVGAVIESGQRTRATSLRAPIPVSADPTISAEQQRIDDATQAAAACVGPVECASSRTAGRLRGAARRIDRWPADARFEPSRSALQQQLEARAAVLDQTAAMRVDGRVSPREQERLETLEARSLAAARRSLDVQLAIGLVTRDEHARRLGALFRGE